MKRLTFAMLTAVAVAVGGSAVAQDKYPSKPVKIIVPYAPGGATDITARLFGEQLKNLLGQQFVVESKPGAFGIIAIEEMARSKPDGYTLMIGNVSTNAITPILFKSKFQIDFEKSVVPVSRLAIYPSFLITTTASFDMKSVKDVVDYAKKNPGKLRYTSAGVEMLHIPNKTGAAGMINDLVVGDAQVAFLNAASSAAMIRAGKLRPVAVLAEKRLADYPDIPTLAEAGYPGVGTLHWQSMLAPAQTPKETLATLFNAITAAAKKDELLNAFQKQLVSVKPNDSLEESQAWLKDQLATWRKITSEVKIDLN
jgi:tripartite-type tricarboxylate transporter receptor subunit TctC